MMQHKLVKIEIDVSKVATQEISDVKLTCPEVPMTLVYNDGEREQVEAWRLSYEMFVKGRGEGRKQTFVEFINMITNK